MKNFCKNLVIAAILVGMLFLFVSVFMGGPCEGHRHYPRSH